MELGIYVGGNDFIWEASVALEFETAYEEFIKFHVKLRSGVGEKRIKVGLQYAEKLFLENVWWPAFHDFNALHPEYQVYDFKGGNRYLDFAYIQPNFRVAIEIDGFGPHWKEISQLEFSDHFQRQNYLVIDGWHVLRFSYYDLNERPRQCQQTIQQLIGRLTGDAGGILQTLNVSDREIVRLALGSNRPITARDVMARIHVERQAATRHLQRLKVLGWLMPASGSTRIRSYRIHPERTNINL